MHQIAVQWIVTLLRDRNIPFLICGGLAAKGYGSKRCLNDIDIFVPGAHFSTVVHAGREFISKAAGRRQEEGWDLTYVQFKYEGIMVEVGSAESVKIFDADNEAWVPLDIDFSRYTNVLLMNLELPLILKDDLISYKYKLSRVVDIEDICSIRENL